MMDGNTRSARVLETLGFVCDAVLRDYRLVRREFKDFSVWALLESDRTG